VDFLQPLNDERKIYLTLTDRDFAAELFRINRPQPVLGVDALDVRRQNFDGINRVALAVENEIGEIEIDTLVGESYVLDGANQGDRRFLASFVAEILAIAVAVSGRLAKGIDGFFVDWVVRIFRNEAGMGLYGRNVAANSEVGRRFNVGNARCATIAGNQSDRERAV
jgi:hypothetical protein